MATTAACARCDELESEFAEFQEMSKALEEEMESDLQEREKQIKTLKHKLDMQEVACDKLQTELTKVKQETEKSRQQLTQQVETLDETVKTQRKRIVELEEKCDQLERRQREAEATIETQSVATERAIEDQVMVHTELEHVKTMDATTIQRLKDQIRDLQEEVLVRERREKEATTQEAPTQAQDEKSKVTEPEVAESANAAETDTSTDDKPPVPILSTTDVAINNMLSIIDGLRETLRLYS